MEYNSEDFEKYYTIQIWSYKDEEGKSLEKLTKELSEKLRKRNNAKIIGIDGPTPFLPDFFNELYGKYRGYLIAIKKNCKPEILKKTCMDFEFYKNKRICDIDVYVSREKSIHRKELK